MADPAPTLELIQFPRALGVLNASPFCMKVEVFLKLAGLAYTVNDRVPPFRLPKKKLPALRDAGVLICDSEAIITHLQRRYAERLPAALRGAESGTDHALRRMVEEHLYFIALHERWIDDAGFALTRQAFFSGLPAPLRALVPTLVRRKMRRDLYGQGVGRHDANERAQRGAADIAALADALGARPYFGGESPALLDCCVYAFIANALRVALDGALRRAVQAQPALVDYVARMEQRVGS